MVKNVTRETTPSRVSSQLQTAFSLGKHQLNTLKFQVDPVQVFD